MGDVELNHEMRLQDLNALDDDDATRELLRCCGSTRWAAAMSAARPFSSAAAIFVMADAIWARLETADWLEAFAAHPRIGESAGPGRGSDEGGGGRAEGEAGWSAQEQSGVTDESRALFVARNRDYEARFGHIFIVCASGRSAAEMLDILERRMRNSPDDELREAAEQQRQITELRLHKLLT